jgi:hypothetical protein
MGVSSQFYSHGVVFHHVDWKPSQIKGPMQVRHGEGAIWKMKK